MFLPLLRLAVLTLIVATALIGVLWVTDILPSAMVASVALKTFGVLTIIFASGFLWRAVRGRENVPDRTDQPVP